jgi:hypothetical protein
MFPLPIGMTVLWIHLWAIALEWYVVSRQFRLLGGDLPFFLLGVWRRRPAKHSFPDKNLNAPHTNVSFSYSKFRQFFIARRTSWSRMAHTRDTAVPNLVLGNRIDNSFRLRAVLHR